MNGKNTWNIQKKAGKVLAEAFPALFTVRKLALTFSEILFIAPKVALL